MDDRINGIFREQAFHDRHVTCVRLDKRNFSAADFFHGKENGWIAVVEVVHAQGIVPLLDKFHEHMSAEIAGSAGDENFTHNCFSPGPGDSRAEYLLLLNPAAHSAQVGRVGENFFQMSREKEFAEKNAGSGNRFPA